MKSFFLIIGFFVISSLCFVLPVQAKTVEYDLTIALEEVNFTGTPTRAMTVNGSIPGPILIFRRG